MFSTRVASWHVPRLSNELIRRQAPFFAVSAATLSAVFLALRGGRAHNGHNGPLTPPAKDAPRYCRDTLGGSN